MPIKVDAVSSSDLLTVSTTIAHEEGLFDMLITTLAVAAMVVPSVSTVLVSIVIGVRRVVDGNSRHVWSLNLCLLLISSRVARARVQ